MALSPVIDANDILIGLARTYYNGEFLGDIRDELRYTKTSTTTEIKALHQIPQVVVGTLSTEATRKITITLHEFNKRAISKLRPDMEEFFTVDGKKVQKDILGPLSYRAPVGLSKTHVMQSDPIKGYLGSMPSRGISPTDTTFLLKSVDGFTVGDEVIFTEGELTATRTISAVDAAAKSITVTPAIGIAFSTNAIVQSETALAMVDDFYLNFAYGMVERAQGSTLLNEGGYMVLDYSYETFAGIGIREISPKADKIFSIDAYHKRRDGDYEHMRWDRVQWVGDFDVALLETEETSIPIELTVLDSEYAWTMTRVKAEAVPGGGW